MRRLGYILAALLALGGSARADQGWSDNQDGQNFACYDVGTIQVNNLIGSGTRCVQVDSTGKLIASSTACGSPLTAGTGITFVAGTAVTSDLSTGVSGGQAVIGGTATTDSLTIKATLATPASGANIYLQTQFGNDYYDTVQHTLALGTGATPISMFKSGGQNIFKTNGTLTVGTTDANLCVIETDGLPAISVDTSQGVSLPTLAGGGTQCLEVNNAGLIGATGAACGSGGSSDHKVLTDVTDTTPDYLFPKLSAVPPVALAIVAGITSPPLTTLQEWHKGSTLTSGSISSWTDSSGNGNTATQAAGGAQPTVNSSSINSNPGATFAGSQGLQSPLNLAGAKTIAIVFEKTGTVGAGTFYSLLSVTTGSALTDLDLMNLGGYQPYSFSADYTFVPALSGIANALDTSPHIFVLTYDGVSTYTVTLDGVVETVVASGAGGRASTDLTSLGGRIDSGGGISDGFVGDIDEELVYGSVLGSTDLTTLQAYLTGLYVGGAEDTVQISITGGVQPPLTFSTGLHEASNIVTGNLSTGVAGGQTEYGGTGAGDPLTITSTTNASKGVIHLGTQPAGGTLLTLNESVAPGVYISDFAGLPGYLPSPNFAFSVSGADPTFVGLDFNAHTVGAVPFITLRQADVQQYTMSVDSGQMNFRVGNAVGTTALGLTTSAEVEVPGLGAGGMVKASAGGVGLLSIAAPGADYQSPLIFSGGTVNTGGTVTLANSSTCSALTAVSGSTTSGLTCSSIPGAAANGAAYFNAVGALDEDAANYGWNDAGKFWTLLAATAPVTPAPGKGVIYIDSASKNIVNLNDAGVSNHGIRTKTCASSSWVSAVADNGISTCSQPAFTDVSGTLACGQVPAITGDTHNGGGGCATVTDHITESSGPTSLAVGAIPDDNPNADVLVRPSGTSTVVGVASNALTTACKVNWYAEVSASIGANAWVPTSSMTTFSSNVAELPCDHKATAGTLYVNIVGNSIVSGSAQIAVTRNASGIGASVITVNSGTATGVHSAAFSTSSGSANDTYGLIFNGLTGSAVGAVNFSAEVVLN